MLPAEEKENLMEGLALCAKRNKQAPAGSKMKPQVIFKFDAESILNYYKGIFTNAALEQITGINQRQIQYYAARSKHPRP
ncbi:MAG: hypothetical protein ABIS36_12100 [Chryseolinea sp.]